MPTKKSADDEKKTFDVAKPGTEKLDIGSKPMVVGHKSAGDPDVKEASDEKKNEDAEKLMSHSKKTVIAPLSEEDKEEKPKEEKAEVSSEKTEDNVEPQEPEKKSEDKKEEPQEAKKDQAESEKDEPSDDDEDAPKKEKTVDDIALERERNLQELIKSKKYNVSIKEKRSSSVVTFLLSFFVVVVLGLILVALLVDAEVLDLGVELPFDLL